MSAQPLDPEHDHESENDHEQDSAEMGLPDGWKPVPERFSAVEDALADLLAGPFAKVSITIPSALRDRLAARVDDRGFSALVTEILEREERRRSLQDFLDAMEEAYGPPTPEQMEAAHAGLEEMWREVKTRSAR